MPLPGTSILNPNLSLNLNHFRECRCERIKIKISSKIKGGFAGWHAVRSNILSVTKGKRIMKVISIWIVLPVTRLTPTREQSPDNNEQEPNSSPTAAEVEAIKDMLVKESGNRAFPERFDGSSFSRN